MLEVEREGALEIEKGCVLEIGSGSGRKNIEREGSCKG